jgi:transcriptional regulator with XRE-family HTH domain
VLRTKLRLKQSELAEKVGISRQALLEIEKGRRSALTPERLEKFKAFLGLNSEETETLYNKAAEARKRSEFDFSDYIIQRDYAMSALRVAKELDADEEDWQRFIDELKQRKE